MVRGSRSGGSAADTGGRVGCFGNERCIELAGIHAGFLVEPNPRRSLAFDGGDRRLLQFAAWLWCARCQDGNLPPSGSAADRVDLVLPHRRHRQPARRRHSRASGKSAEPGRIFARALSGKRASALIGCGRNRKTSRNSKEGSEAMEENEIKPEDLKLSDKLAVERTVLAADRTMLAGVRTSLSFIGFGFTIFNVLRYVQEHSPAKVMRPETPRNVALFMLVAGTVPLFVMMIQYCRSLKRMGKENVLTNPNFQMAGVIFLLGTILLITLIGDIMLL